MAAPVLPRIKNPRAAHNFAHFDSPRQHGGARGWGGHDPQNPTTSSWEGWEWVAPAHGHRGRAVKPSRR